MEIIVCNIAFVSKVNNWTTVEKILQDEKLGTKPIQISQLQDIGKDPCCIMAVISSNASKNWKAADGSINFILSDLRGQLLQMTVKDSARRIIPENNSEGLVLLIIKPVVVLDSTGKLGVVVESQKQLLVVGNVIRFGRCGALRKDGVNLCKMPVDKAQCDHCVYHAVDLQKKPMTSLSKQFQVQGNSWDRVLMDEHSTPSFQASVDANNKAKSFQEPGCGPDGQYVNATVNMAGSKCSGGKLVTMEVLPLGRSSDLSSAGHSAKRLASNVATGVDTAGVKRRSVPPAADLLTSVLNGTLPPSSSLRSSKGTSITDAHLKDSASHRVVVRGDSELGEDSEHADHEFALRRHGDLVDSLLGTQQRPDSLELKTIRNIVEKDRLLHGQNNISSGSVRVPPPSTSVFAFGAEVHRQQLLEKENLQAARVAALPSNALRHLQGSALQKSMTSSNKPSGNSILQQPINSASKFGTVLSNRSLSSGGVSKTPRQAATQSQGQSSEPLAQPRHSAGLKMVGSSLVDTSRLLSNAASAASSSTPGSTSNSSNSVIKGNLINNILAQSSNKSSSNNPSKQPASIVNPQSNTASTVASSAAKGQKSAMDSAIDALLSRKSINASDANDEWFESYAVRMDKLAQREYAQEKSSGVHSIHVKAFQCHSCSDLITELMPQLCKQSGHHVTAVSTTKQFFECGSCGRKDFTLGKGTTKLSLPPDRRCGMCGNNNWKACGQRGSGPLSVSAKDRKPDADLQGGKLILSASEWTTRSDAVHMSARTSTL